MRISELKYVHSKIIHSRKEFFTEKDLDLEEVWIKKYPYDSLNTVCSDCFRTPD